MNNNSKTHVVIGSGPLGQSVAQELIRRGLPVRIVNRSGKTNLSPQVEILAADMRQPGAALAACKNASVVFQCAQPPYHRWTQEFPSLQNIILSAATDAGARLVIGENLYMYGEVNGKIHENLPYAAHTKKGQVRAKMSEAALEAHKTGRLPVVIGRGSDFFGPGVLDSTFGARVIIPALKGKTASAVGSLDVPHTYTYIEDFGKALVELSLNESSYGQTWHVPNTPALTQRELVTMLFKEVGLPPRMSGMGTFMMQLGGLFIPEARESVEMMYEFEKPFVVDDSKFRQAFPHIQPTPMPEALRRTIAWYREHAH